VSQHGDDKEECEEGSKEAGREEGRSQKARHEEEGRSKKETSTATWCWSRTLNGYGKLKSADSTAANVR
jgi:hypothetical protein